MQDFLQATAYLDYTADNIQTFVRDNIRGVSGARDKAVKLFYAVRDRIRYDPYSLTLDEAGYRASNVLAQKAAYCIPKSVFLAAAARAAGIPAALGFADVRNHLNTEKLRALMGTDLFIYHGYAAFYLNGKWVKVSSAFNIELCDRFGVRPLEFDGVNDALMHSYDAHNRRHMEYIHDHGLFADLPFQTIKNAFQQTYPKFIESASRRQNDAKQRFENEQPVTS